MTTPADATDGRSARSARTREAVVGALLDLIHDGDLRPTARRVAERAGISLRSVYVHFEDLEDLFLAAAEHQTHQITRLFRETPTEGPFPARLRAYVDQRCEILEEVAPVRRAAAIQEPFSHTLSLLLDFSRQASRDQISRIFAPELGRLDGEARHRRLAAVDAVTSSDGWELLRRSNGLAVEEARAAVAEAIAALLGERT